MINSDVLTDWRPLFLMIAGASASLTGLLFVALSLHAREIASQPLYRYRAKLSLASLMAILVIASLVLIPGQNAFGLGVKEMFPIATIFFVLALGILELGHIPDAARRPYAIRTAIAMALVVVAAVGDILLATGRSAGLEILALCCVVFLVWLVINAWALVIGLADERSGQNPR
jgi:hypothetical protein